MLGRTAVQLADEVQTKRIALIPFVRQALRAQPALSVRGSSRRITSMRFRPANTRVINRRDDRFDRHSRCFPLAEGKQRCKIRPPALLISGHSILEVELQGELNVAFPLRTGSHSHPRSTRRDSLTCPTSKLNMAPL